MVLIRSDAHGPEFLRKMPPQLPVRVATTANITIATALNAGDSIDGVTLAAGDRVLVKDQSSGSQNGIYIAGPTPGRSFDFAEGLAAIGSLIYVIDGTANGGKLFKNTNLSAITIDTTAITFAEFSGGVTQAAFDDHSARHEDGGADAILVTDLDGYPGGTVNFLRADGTFADPSVPSGGGTAFNEAVYGPGSDGDLTVSAPASLTRDMYFNNLTVNDVLSPQGWRIFVKGTLSGTGIIRNTGGDGGNGGNGTGAAGGAAGAAGAQTPNNNIGRGSNGRIGRVGGFNAVGLNGTTGQLSTMFRPDGTGVDHAAGANGGNGTNAGGTGAAATTGTNTLDAKPYAYPACVELKALATGAAINYDTASGVMGSGGSGGGAATGGGGGSGGSGAGGGPILVVAKTWSGSFVIESKGGNGGNGGNGFGTGVTGGGAPGNGGPGGLVSALYSDRSGWSGSIDVSGGSAGTPGTGQNGGTNGGTGSAGPTGHKLEYRVS